MVGTVLAPMIRRVTFNFIELQYTNISQHFMALKTFDGDI
jgi:hypothetical protein